MIRGNADRHALNLRPVLDALREEGIASLGQIADALNERDMVTPHGGRWHDSSVRNLIAHLDTANG